MAWLRYVVHINKYFILTAKGEYCNQIISLNFGSHLKTFTEFLRFFSFDTCIFRKTESAFVLRVILRCLL